jgi:hypothetical protein
MKRQKYDKRYHYYSYKFCCMNCEHFYRKMEGKISFFGCKEMLKHSLNEKNVVDHNRVTPFSYCDNFIERSPF